MTSTYHGLTLDTNAVTAAESVYAALAMDLSSRLVANETCSMLAPVPPEYPNCRFARSCRSCLKKDGCMVDATGLCSDPTTNDYTSRRHFRFAAYPTLAGVSRQRYFFPADSADYCVDSDAACQACRANPAFASANDSRFCMGEGGCVCIANCIDTTTLPIGKIYLLCSDELTATTPLKAVKQASDAGTMVQSLLTIAGTLAIVSVILVYRLRKLQQERSQREAEVAQLRRAVQRRARRPKSEELGVGVLSLEGWMAHRAAIPDEDGDYRPESGGTLYVVMGGTPLERARTQQNAV